MKDLASAIALCETDGRVIAGNALLARMLGETTFDDTEIASLAELARRLDCAGLWEQFIEFVASGRMEEPVRLRRAAGEQRVLFRRLDGPRERHWVLVEFHAANGSEQAALSEVGRMTARLIHDFKNQMGGLKLYAAFLKRRFADQPEGAEISEKIIHGLNVMSEHANLVGKLTRPLKLNFETTDLIPLISQVMGDLRQRAEAREVELRFEHPSDLPPLALDAQQLRAALYAILARAIDTSPASGRVRVTLAGLGAELALEIADSGETLDGPRLASFFDFLAEHGINETALGLALAKRIIEQHGGQAAALVAPGAGTVVRIRLPAGPASSG
jgi:signal transduction histidine kinase